MVLKITIDREADIKDDSIYTVHVGSRRILTVVTYCDETVTKWLKQVLKYPSNTRGRRSRTILVGVVAEQESLSGHKDSPYELLSLCVGSHCLIYPHLDVNPPKFLKSFFRNPRVVAVGTDMANVAGKLKRVHGIEIENAVDVEEVALKGIKEKGHLLRRHHSLDLLAEMVLGKDKYVVRPEEKVPWFTYKWDLTNDKVELATLDPYLCFWIASELFDSTHRGPTFSAKKKKN